jgi:hypothetical protein
MHVNGALYEAMDKHAAAVRGEQGALQSRRGP